MVNDIVVKLQGGLGNQMFQYAFAKQIQMETNANLILDISDFQYDKAGRRYALEPFDLSMNKVVIDDSGKYNYKYDQRKNWLIKLGVKLFPNILYKMCSIRGRYIWEEIKYKEILINYSHKTIFIHGLWQSEKYFSKISKKIKEEFRVNTPLSDVDKKIIDEIKNNNSVCVHIRRGDFLNSNNQLYNCSQDYFIEAMDYIEKRVNSPVFYIFSDDIEDVKRNFDFSHKRIIYIQDKRTDYEEFRLMYNFKYFIISNSTFSWWSSYLREDGGIVVAPLKWYNDKTDISNLIRTDMVCL